MSSCKIRLNYGSVKSADGTQITVDKQPTVESNSRLMNELWISTNGNLRKTLSLFGYTFSPEFNTVFKGRDDVGLDELSSFIAYNKGFNNTPLNPIENNFLSNVLISNPDGFNSDDFVNAFTSNSDFVLSRTKLEKSGLFTESTISDILSGKYSPEFLMTIANKLDNTESDIIPNFNLFDVNSPNGKLNPDLLLGRFVVDYQGLSTESEIIKKASEIGDDVVLSNLDLIPNIIESVKGKQALHRYNVVVNSDGDIEYEKNKKETSLESTISISHGDFNPDLILNNIYELIEITPHQYNINQDSIVDIIESLRYSFSQQGVDIGDLSSNVYKLNHDSFQDMLSILHNLTLDLSESSEESLDSALQNAEEMKSKGYINDRDYNDYDKEVVELNNIDNTSMVINSTKNITEDLLFKDKGLVRVKDNVYAKVNSSNDSIDTLYSFMQNNRELVPSSHKVFSSKSKSSKSSFLKDLDDYVSEVSQSMLGSDRELLKKIVAIKLINGFDLGNKIDNPVLDKVSFVSDSFNPTSFLRSFISDISDSSNREGVIDLSEMFYLSEKGLETRSPLGPYTVTALRNQLTDAKLNGLRDYARFSGFESLQPIINEDLDFDFEIARPLNTQEYRDYFASNILSLPRYNKGISGGNDLIITKNEEPSTRFININNSLFEKVYGDTVFKKVEYNQDTFTNQIGLSKPTLSDGDLLFIDNNYEDKSIEPVEDVMSKNTYKVDDEEIDFC